MQAERTRATVLALMTSLAVLPSPAWGQAAPLQDEPLTLLAQTTALAVATRLAELSAHEDHDTLAQKLKEEGARLTTACAGWPTATDQGTCAELAKGLTEGTATDLAALVSFARAAVGLADDPARFAGLLRDLGQLDQIATQPPAKKKRECKDKPDLWQNQARALVASLRVWKPEPGTASLDAKAYLELTCTGAPKGPHAPLDEAKGKRAFDDDAGQCQEEATLCLFVHGELLPGESEFELERGDRLEVKIWGCPDFPGGALSIKGIKSADRAFRPKDTDDDKKDRATEAAEEDKCKAYKVVHSQGFDVADEPRLRAVRITHTPDASNNKPSRTYRFPVERGLYFADIGVMIPITLFGANRVLEEPGSGGAPVYRLRSTHLVTPALSVHIYPLGMPVGEFSPLLTLFSDDNGSDPFAYLADFFRLGSLEFGADGQAFPNATARLYGGLALNLAAGFSISAGVTLLELEFLPEGIRQGQLVPEVKPSIPQLWAPRVYFGLTLSTEAVEAAKSLFSS